MYEHRSSPLLSQTEFLQRLAIHAGAGLVVVLGSLTIGILGYRGFEHMTWLDALLNASMILGGMGPVTELHTSGGKLFASVYALYSGFVVLVVAGLLFVPVAHRILHRFHLEMDDASSQDTKRRPR